MDNKILKLNSDGPEGERKKRSRREREKGEIEKGIKEIGEREIVRTSRPGKRERERYRY